MLWLLHRLRRDLESLEICRPCGSLRGRAKASGSLKGLNMVEELRFHTCLERFELMIEYAIVRVLGSKALGRALSRGKAVLLEGTIDIGLLLELLERV